MAKEWYQAQNIKDWHPIWVVFAHALEVGNHELVLQFNGRYYEQLCSLAMGVADSPDIANLYLHHFKVRKGQVHNKPWLKYYKRFIDDVFTIIEADSEQIGRAHV